MTQHHSHLAREVAGQPEDWAREIQRADEVAELLPRRGERVATIGCGTSWFMGQAYAARREELGHGVTDAFTASEHHLDRGYDRVVVITRSGTTSEVIEVIEELSRRGTPHVSFVATPGTPVFEQSQHTVSMEQVDEESVVQTRFATSTLALLRASLGDDLASAITDARAVLSEGEDAMGPLLQAEQLTFLGRGWTVGLAHEAALKLRESAQFWAESYPAMEYRHGPISIAAPGRATWMIGELPKGLGDQVRETGAHLEHRPTVDPLAELVRVHRLCLARAQSMGIDPDQPRNLTRSIVLDS
ncbi:SIS domain-containing protein [Marihabitans asiaticum]|uniref:Fructoselysine-6-P-deglycase FrlB-like protein n=1 Tax=Marihabitans asiaticum TaxID=415218 RepID=A0A560WGU3_9MICO|nr:SIS domain-containing protein [Marihabitans asiaticum]TWD16903.1 fructoselysine-6-P-deglycase FrlB-like protein [Marihabitans asiaticum]